MKFEIAAHDSFSSLVIITFHVEQNDKHISSFKTDDSKLTITSANNDKNPFSPIPLFASLRSEFGLNGRLKGLKENQIPKHPFYQLNSNPNAPFSKT